ncbi:MAG TPA: TonB family protein [Terriglobales bacterium]|nr:TonB family protein [Terriglobales bacterium]
MATRQLIPIASETGSGRDGSGSPRPPLPEIEAPALLLEIDDERTRARRREGMLISIIAHIVAVLGLVLLPPLLPQSRGITVATTEELLRNKELTYLELPPDSQAPPAKPPDTKIISDKDRIATSRAPVPDKKTLDELRDSRRPGPPGVSAPPAPPSPGVLPQAGGSAAAAPPAQGGTEQTPPGTEVASLQAPPMARGRGGVFGTGRSAGSTLEEATRAAAARGGAGGTVGSGGDYGLGPGSPAKVRSDLDIMSDTMGVDFGPYLSRVLLAVRQNWYALVPEAARPPLLKSGKVSIQFAILKDGSVAGMRLAQTSGDVSLDRAAWGGITASNPFPPLPAEFRGNYLELRFHFYYNPGRNELR